MLNQKDIRSLIKKVVLMSLTEYKNNIKIINANPVAQQLNCIHTFQQALDEIQEEEDTKTAEEVPAPEPAKVLEVLFLEGIKKARISSGARKKMLKYLQNQEYRKEIKDEKWIENTEFIKKIIQALNNYNSRNSRDESESSRRYSDSQSRNRGGVSPIHGSSGSRDNSGISIRFWDFSVDSSGDREENKQEEAPKFITSFFKRRNKKNLNMNSKTS